MNRNYDPLARYPYKGNEIRTKIIENLNQKEIEYIVNYSISPDEFIEYIDNYNFNAYHINQYNKASEYLTNLNSNQVVNIVERMISKKYDFDKYLFQFSFLNYDEIMYYLVNGYK